jgi:hypothetical protein
VSGGHFRQHSKGQFRLTVTAVRRATTVPAAPRAHGNVLFMTALVTGAAQIVLNGVVLSHWLSVSEVFYKGGACILLNDKTRHLLLNKVIFQNDRQIKTG